MDCHNFFLVLLLCKSIAVPPIKSLENELTKLSNDQLLLVKGNIKLLFEQSIQMLESDHPKPVSNSLQTLCALFYAIFKKQATDVGVDVINTIFDFQEIEQNMKTLIAHCNNLLISDVSSDAPRFMCLNLLLVLITGTKNVSQNILLEYIMINSLFDSFVRRA